MIKEKNNMNNSLLDKDEDNSLQEIRKQLEFLNNCFSEKYCKRVG